MEAPNQVLNLRSCADIIGRVLTPSNLEKNGLVGRGTELNNQIWLCRPSLARRTPCTPYFSCLLGKSNRSLPFRFKFGSCIYVTSTVASRLRKSDNAVRSRTQFRNSCTHHGVSMADRILHIGRLSLGYSLTEIDTYTKA